MNKYNLNIPRISPSFTLLLVYYFGNICEEKKINIKFNNIYMFILAFISIFYCYNLGYVYINQNKF